ncbi:MAG: hypothetical protein LUG61_10315 [Lachnospiraceae bacterium]|nr:hypothetical protein [Lachnospiraceae bacterium]
MRNLVNLLQRYRRILIPIETLALVFCVFMLLRSSDDNENASDMPELDGDYAYVCIQIVEIDLENYNVRGEVIDFEDVSLSGVNVGLLTVGSTGFIDLSGMNGPFYSFFKLMSEGQVYVVSYADKGQTDFPIEAVSFENMTNFRERVTATNGIEETMDESFMEDSDVLDELTGVSEADQEEAGSVEITAPDKADVMAMREIVLDGMSEEDAEHLCSLMKEADTKMESLIIYDNFFSRLSDPDDLKWNYFDESGEIQIGWATGDDEQTIQEIMSQEGLTETEYYEKYGNKVVAENKYSAEEFAQLLEEIQGSVLNEALKNDLQQIIDEARLAAETHDVEHAEKLYYLLHDMDYILLNYRLDTEGQYVKDKSTISKYYGVLSVYD